MQNYAFHCVNSAQLAVPKELWHYLSAPGSLAGWAEQQSSGIPSVWEGLWDSGWGGGPPCLCLSACWPWCCCLGQTQEQPAQCAGQQLLPGCHPVMLALHIWSRGRNWSTWGSKASLCPVPFVGILEWNHRNLPEDWFIFNDLRL